MGLIAEGVNVNQKTVEGGETPLWVAASNGNKDIVEALLAAGAYVNLPAGRTFETPLLAAVCRSHEEDFRSQEVIDVMEALIKAGANMNQWDPYGQTPLIAAAQSGFT